MTRKPGRLAANITQECINCKQVFQTQIWRNKIDQPGHERACSHCGYFHFYYWKNTQKGKLVKVLGIVGPQEYHYFLQTEGKKASHVMRQMLRLGCGLVTIEELEGEGMSRSEAQRMAEQYKISDAPTKLLAPWSQGHRNQN
jgi:hypothetical protein